MDLGPKPPYLREIPLAELLDAKIHTSEFLAALGEDASDAQIEADAARQVFGALTDPNTNDSQKRQSIALLETPEAVRHLVGMLTAYDWEYVHHANEIRGKLVSSLLEDVDDPDPRVRMKAVELLGKVKEIALFEERTVVRKENVSDEEINGRLRALLEKARQRAAGAEPAVDVPYVEKTT